MTDVLQKYGITNLYFTCLGVGSIIRSTKKEYRWEFDKDAKHIKICYYFSLMSEKRKLLYNGEVIRNEKKEVDSYAVQFERDGIEFRLVQTFNVADLIINGESFQHIYQSIKNKASFENQGPTSQSTVASSTKKTDCDIENLSQMNFAHKKDGGNNQKMFDFDLK